MQYQYMRLMNGAGYPVWKNIRLGVAIPLVVFLLIGSNEVVAGWELFNRDASTMTNPVRTVQAVPSGQPGIMETRSSTGTTVTTNETKATPEIQSLAAGLEYDPKLIFEYVSNHIEFRNPSFGIANGAAGCLLNEMGNDWDQAALLSSLLRVSGYSTRFVLGKVEYTKIDLANWFGVDTNQVAEMLADNGNEAFIGADPSLMGMYRMWTEVSIDGNWYVFDPAFREYTYVEGLDLTNITGYSRSDFLSYATNGATITEDYVQYLDGDAIDAALLCYSTNLMACIRSEYPSAVMSEIIGGRKQNSVVCESFPTNLPKATYSEAVEVWDHIPATNCASLDLEMFENEYTLMGYDIAGKRVSFTCPDFAFDMYIWLDGELWTVITNEDLSSYPLLTVEIKRPYYPENHYMSSFQMHVFGSYVLVHEFDGTAGDCTEKIAEQLARDVEAGYAEESEPVLCGALHLAAVNGLQQAYLSRQLLSKLGNVAGYSKHIIGVIGEESHLYPDEQRGGGFIMQRHGYFVDLQNCIFAVTPKDGEIEDALAWTRSAMFMLSGLEHVMLEQSQGVEHEAVSTIKLLHLNNELGNRTYYADTNNWNLVQQGVTNYDEFKVAEIDAYIAYGYVYLLPQDAQMTAAGWDRSCMGYTYYYNLETNFALAMLISGDYTNFYGGQSVESHYPFGPVQLDQYQNLSPANWPKVESEEPVDLYTGHYMLENTDLTVGGGTPQGLQLTRSYNSGLATTMGPLGYGWTHGYGAKILEGHQSAPLFGTRKPIDATAMIAEGMVLLDLLRCHPDLTRWPTAYIVAKWGMDQLLGCSASLRIDADSLEFVRLADGSYAGPADLNATLTKSNGLFTLQERMGNTMLFNTNGQLAARIDIDGNAVNYHYDGDGLLTELTNTFGRKLTFTYTNNLVSSVNDSCGRTIIYQYSTNGNLVSYTDPEGNAWTYEYDSEGHHRIAVLRDPLNQITASNTYGSAGRVVSQKNGLGETWNFYYTGQSSIEEDPLGGQMTYDFNDQGQLTGAEDALSNRADAVYNSDGLLVQETDARGFVTHYYYDAHNNLTNTVDALTNSTTFVYDDQHRLIEVVSPLNKSTKYAYDAHHHVTNIVDALSNTTIFTYYNTGQIHSITDAEGNLQSFTYNDNGELERFERTDGGTNLYGYNSWGDVTNLCNALQQNTCYGYDKRRQRTSITDALGSTVSNVYNAAGLLIRTIDPLSNMVSYGYSATYKLTAVTNAEGGVISYTYDSTDRLSAITDPMGRVHSNGYDAAGSVISESDPMGHTTGYGYDSVGNLISLTNAMNKVSSFEYDALNRLVSSINPLGYSRCFEYDDAGRMTAVIDNNGNKMESLYDPLGRQIAVKNADGVIEHFEYDKVGNLIVFENGVGEKMEYTFDGKGVVLSITNAMGKGARITCDALGNILTRMDANGAETTYTYNEVNDLVLISYPDSTTVAYHYDAGRRLTNMIDAGGTTTRHYDNMGRLVSVTDHNGNTVGYSHDLNGNRTSITYPGNLTVSNIYNEANRLVSVIDWASRQIDYAYNALAWVTNSDFPNAVKATYTYDDAQRLLGIQYRTNSTPFVDHHMTLDPVGNITQLDINAGLVPSLQPDVKRYITDPADTLTTILEKTTPDAPSWATNMLAVDNNGNLLTYNDGAESSVQYDYENRPTNLVATALTNQYGYDGLGDRTRRTVNGVQHRDVLDRSADLHNVLMTTDAAGNPIRYYIWGRGLVAQIETNGTVYYYHPDTRGSTLAMTDASGSTVAEYAYSPYGQIMNHTGVDTHYNWIGTYGVWHEGGDMFHMKARYYNVTLRRFVTPDPIGINGGFNLYAYANNNPALYVDPLGLDARLEQGNEDGIGGSLNDLIHQYISLDLYDETGAVIGEVSYSFGARSIFGKIPLPIGEPYLQAYKDPYTSDGFQDGIVLQTVTMTPEETNVWLERMNNALTDWTHMGLYPIENCRSWSKGTITFMEREQREKKKCEN